MKRKSLVMASRTMLVMLAIAAVAMLGIGVVVVLRGDPPKPSGWLRSAFGQVFAAFALAMAALLGVPSALGLWAMAGASSDDAVPALTRPTRRILGGVAVATVVVAAVVIVWSLSVVAVVELALVGLVALGTLGLAGAISFSIHRWRAIGSAVALIVVSLGTAWMLRALLGIER